MSIALMSRNNCECKNNNNNKNEWKADSNLADISPDQKKKVFHMIGQNFSGTYFKVLINCLNSVKTYLWYFLIISFVDLKNSYIFSSFINKICYPI